MSAVRLGIFFCVYSSCRKTSLLSVTLLSLSFSLFLSFSSCLLHKERFIKIMSSISIHSPAILSKRISKTPAATFYIFCLHSSDMDSRRFFIFFQSRKKGGPATEQGRLFIPSHAHFDCPCVRKSETEAM